MDSLSREVKGAAGRGSFNTSWDTAQRTPSSGEQANRQTTQPRGRRTGRHHQLISSGALTPPPRSRLGTKVEKQLSFPRRFCSPGFLLVSCSLGKPHSTSSRLRRWPFLSATKVNQKSPGSRICDPIKLQKTAVLRIHREKLRLPDVPGPTASYTGHWKSRS